jgi:hypothetical protein
VKKAIVSGGVQSGGELPFSSASGVSAVRLAPKSPVHSPRGWVAATGSHRRPATPSGR